MRFDALFLGRRVLDLRLGRHNFVQLVHGVRGWVGGIVGLSVELDIRLAQDCAGQQRSHRLARAKEFGEYTAAPCL